LQADVEQACVVTLEPVRDQIREDFDIQLWPEEDLPVPESGLVDLNKVPEPEPIVNGQIEVGRIVFECLASAINPYPRRPGAIFVPPNAESREETADSPFAMLAKLKTKA
jgi:hypothetical protein